MPPRFTVLRSNTVEAQACFSKYYEPFVISFGIFLNSVLIHTYKRAKVRKFSGCLPALSGAEIGCLLVHIFHWLKSRAKVDAKSVTGICQVSMYGTYAFNFLVAWFLVGLVSERIFAMGHQIWETRKITKFLMNLYVTIISLAGCLLYTMCLWTFGINPIIGCTVLHAFQKANRIFAYVDALIAVLIPILLLGVLAVLMLILYVQFIVRYVIKNLPRERRVGIRDLGNHKDESCVSLAVLIVVVTHLAMILPDKYLHVEYIIIELSGILPQVGPTTIVQQMIFKDVLLTCYAFNPIIYFACLSSLRSTFYENVTRWPCLQDKRPMQPVGIESEVA
ncbi:uncharacterized protein LOC141901132 [Tubulanus polymorphus]|uniref:uncharacterized protein LOC141901132 n=1 Tax=Tubulanus polymorphus TaxID=672921 RepID=UPI003DA67FFD